MTDIFVSWQPWQVALAETVAAELIRHGLTPEEMRDLARAYMLEHVASEAERAVAAPGAAPYRRPHSGQRLHRELPRPEWQKEVERGLIHMKDACPKCGGVVRMKRMCPSVSPRIRTQLACMNDECDFIAVSERSCDYLAREGLEGNVEVQ